MLPPVKNISVVPLRCVTAREMEECVLAVSDKLQDTDYTLSVWRDLCRTAAVDYTPDYWATYLIFDENGQGGGWCGWLPYQEEKNVWQSTTWLSPALRGRNLIPYFRCHQIHSARNLVTRWNLTGVKFLSSIDQSNIVSFRASDKYLKKENWYSKYSVCWELKEETRRGRIANVLEWPADHVAEGTLQHTCHLHSESELQLRNTCR